jgi:C1A family cysteine protease
MWKIAGYGWRPDLPDQRDHMYAAPPAILRRLPASADLRSGCSPVYNQGNLGSCTANAIAGAIEFDQRKERLRSKFIPSRLFIYYNERAMEGSVASDSGAALRDGIKTVGKQGACPEAEWPYEISRFADKPPPRCYRDARKHRAISYQRLMRDLHQLKGCLASGYPFVFGFTVYESFEGASVARTGQLQMPGAGERAIGGHAVVAVGYKDADQTFTVRNSYGASWGMRGYFTMPVAYLLHEHLASDFWTIRAVR